METIHQKRAASTPVRPSTLPRASRLPVLRARSSALFDSDTAENDDAGQKAAIARSSRKVSPPVITAPAVLPRSPQITSKDAIGSGDPSRQVLLRNGPRRALRPAGGSRSSTLRSNSGNGHLKSAPVADDPTAQVSDRAEDDDQLGALDRRHVALGQESHDDCLSKPVNASMPSEPRPPGRERHGSRPSLSDRAIESLQNLPATPKERRSSNFFSPVDSPMRPPPRPASSLSRQSSNQSRPGTSDGSFARPAFRPASPAKKAPASMKAPSKTSAGGFGFTPASESSKRINGAKRRNGDHEPSTTSRSPSPSKRDGRASLLNSRSVQRPGGKTVGARPAHGRPGLGGAFEPPSIVTAGSARMKSGPSVSPVAPQSTKRTVSNPSKASSSALRQQIAAAKAAARKDRSKIDAPNGPLRDEDVGSEIQTRLDPFNQAPKDGKHIIRNRVRAARLDGRLNIAALSLKTIPDEVLGMYSAAVMDEENVNWAEVVDLTRLIAADNELEVISDDIFPDMSAEELATNEQSNGNQFGGLEMLDMHGNMLRALPLGLRRLDRLTSLNLSHNKLDNSALDVVTQIHSLKELRIGHNALTGHLPAALCQLKLETLDLQSNRLLGLPEAIRELASLRVLNISGNQLTTLPMESLNHVPLMDLDASNNALIGSLFPPGAASGLAKLQSLNVANNSLAALTFSGRLHLPQVRYIDVTNNHITALPPVADWTDLITLIAADNKIAELPEGFATLRKVKNTNFTSNELRLLDPEIARMDSLDSLVLASNPLRDKKYLTMNAEDIKRDLRAKLAPNDGGDGDVSDPETVIDLSTGESSTAISKTSWQVKANGLLDLSTRGLYDDIKDALSSFLRGHTVRHLVLHTNKLTSIPSALSLSQDLRVVDLSGNALSSAYLVDELEMPSLQELNLSHCSLTTLDPLTRQLVAPNLHALHLTANRLTGAVPTLRDTYPKLSLLLASDNKFTSVTADALRGLHTVSLKSNNIEQLPAEIGLLWDEGLKSIDVGSNAFRVPGYRILEKGTEATLRWLREKLPIVRTQGLDGVGGPVVG